MKKTIFLDVGGTIFIKDSQGNGMLNPAIIYLVENIPPKIPVIVVSDMIEFNVPELLQKLFPLLKPTKIFYRGEYPWIDKTKPETYTHICNLIQTTPFECILIDNEQDFREPAATIGIKTFDIHQSDIEKVLMLF